MKKTWIVDGLPGRVQDKKGPKDVSLRELAGAGILILAECRSRIRNSYRISSLFDDSDSDSGIVVNCNLLVAHKPKN